MKTVELRASRLGLDPRPLARGSAPRVTPAASDIGNGGIA